MNNTPVKIDTLFQAVGIHAAGFVLLNDNTYDFDPNNPENNWLYGAFLGFKKLMKEGLNPKTFCTIGTSSGVDSIGADKVFQLAEIFQTDIHPNVIDVAHKNTSGFVGKSTKVKTLLGNLCEPLIERGISVDLLYANIPNIPSEKPVLNKKTSSSRFQVQASPESIKIFDKWFLSLQHQFLKQAKSVLNMNGVVLVAIGDRVPCFVMQELFEKNGYKSSELVNIYKVQTEPEEVITGYAEQEILENIEFDFYDHEKASMVWQKECMGKNLSVEEIKKILQPFHLSAFEALRQFRERGRSVGHIYSIFKLVISQ